MPNTNVQRVFSYEGSDASKPAVAALEIYMAQAGAQRATGQGVSSFSA